MGRQGKMRDDSTEILSQTFSAGGRCEQIWHGQECPLFDVVHPVFPLPFLVSSMLLKCWTLARGMSKVTSQCPRDTDAILQFEVHFRLIPEVSAKSPLSFFWTKAPSTRHDRSCWLPNIWDTVLFVTTCFVSDVRARFLKE